MGAQVEVGGIVDLDPARAEELGSKVGAPVYADVAELCGSADPDSIRPAAARVDAVVVAVPTLSHYEVVREALEAGNGRPGREADRGEPERSRAAAGAGRRPVVACFRSDTWSGSIRRSPAFVVASTEPRYIEAHRMGPFSDRATDIDIVRDLMIHDLDILQQILGEQPERIEAMWASRCLTPNIDIANARISFPSGCVANLTASRVSNAPQRKLRFFQHDSCVAIDFLAQSATVFRQHKLNGAPAQIVTEELEVGRRDALLSQMCDFIRAVRTREPPKVDGAGGLDALRTAVRVVEAMPPLHELE